MRIRLVILAVALLLAIPLFINLPNEIRLFRDIQNSGHAALFFIIAYTLRCNLPAINNIVILVFCVVAGVGIEVVQFFTGGDCDPWDVYLDVVGSLAGVIGAYAWLKQKPACLIPAALLLLLGFLQPLRVAWVYLQLEREWPVLCSFDETGLGQLMEFYEGAKVSLEPAPPAWSENRSRVAKITFPSEGWPGLSLFDLASDWQTKQELQIDVWSPNPEPLGFSIALRSRQNHSDHHDTARSFVLQPGFNKVVLPLAELRGLHFAGKSLLGNVGWVVLFTTAPPPGTVLYVDNLRLH